MSTRQETSRAIASAPWIYIVVGVVVAGPDRSSACSRSRRARQTKRGAAPRRTSSSPHLDSRRVPGAPDRTGRPRARRRRRRGVRRPERRAEPCHCSNQLTNGAAGPGHPAGRRRPPGRRRGSCSSSRSTARTSCRASGSSSTSLKSDDVAELTRTWSCATAIAELMPPSARRSSPSSSRSRRSPTRASSRRRSARAPPSGCSTRSPRSASPTPTSRRPPTAARPSSGPARAPTPRPRPSCCTRTTTCSRRSTRTAWRTPPFELTEVRRALVRPRGRRLQGQHRRCT